MKVEDIQALGRGDLIYRVDESGGTPRVVEYRYDFPQIAKLSADTLDLWRAIRIERTAVAGHPAPSGQGAVERVTARALVDEFGLTPGEAAALYVQGKVRAELRALSAAREAAEASAAARAWFAARHGASKQAG
jgi:hypothetical protein